MMKINSNTITAKDVLERIAQVRDDEPYKICVRAGARDAQYIRFVTYCNLTKEDIDLGIKKIVYVLKEFDSKLKNKL